ncbi:MAG: phenylalanine--tRNA ligase subunit alpha [Thermoguttaceae bacterium]|nr:phenylalanine--tRNA ligase subunit alpha [Thermoguttaceae bacterium]MBQ2555459.1 phenylalanine--tRNA ligase subunit alpha [Thermoguttaceae bacterium]MBQ3823072.1 phenylalanine--tRNA ligase subunit alpha [Thermoguttaceae bacterium]MBQ4196011.1 phenylalanine--tRNA ligase subunit alpha [Thermoguttaceae bacterium]MBQ4203949.1 phenylalanine--tRNA ligase subunit alpha [Thermoguttaceae bacterium]
MQNIKEQLEQALKSATTAEQVEQIRIDFLGRKGSITLLAKNADFSKMSVDEKKNFGRNLNELKQFATQEITKAAEACKAATVHRKSNDLDLTAPGKGRRLGALHPITLVQMELEDIFQGMGFSVVYGPEIESEYFCFEALNIPHDHPARDMQDTFWLKNQLILRTHTSANQVRTLKRFGAPIRAIFPGRCFRYEAIDPSHENTFYQCEGVVVDKDISVANLVAIMRVTLSQVFKRDVKVRLRPGYFPFVEPGFELDLNCLLCGGKGCPTCKNSGWIELIPCGLIHPEVLRHGGIDPKEYSGFAFGVGLTRLAMMKFGITDIRYMNCGDLRVNEQFSTLM